MRSTLPTASWPPCTGTRWDRIQAGSKPSSCRRRRLRRAQRREAAPNSSPVAARNPPSGVCSSIRAEVHSRAMAPSPATPLTLAEDAIRVSALLHAPPDAIACYVLAHGAGAGMAHPFMQAVADGLAARKIATLRYQFPYMESGSRRPDRPALAQAAVAAAVRKATTLAPRLPLIAGGKSFGGRMTSQAQAREALPKVRGLAFLGFPLHLPNKPSTERAAHLADV